MNPASRRKPTSTRPRPDRVRRAWLLAAALALGACAPALTLVPITPLMSTALSTRPGDDEAAKQIADLELKQDWDALSALALQHLASRPSDDDWLVIHGYARMRAGDYPQAIEAFRRVAQRTPEDSDAQNLLGEALRLSGKVEEAVVVLERSVSRNPNSPPGWYMLGEVYRESQRLERAKGAYRESVRLEPEYSMGWYGLVTILVRTGPKDEYEDAIKQLQTLNPGLLQEHLKAVSGRKP
jgi:cytochrome c-type biogenesis protein CcmH/NrfG